MEVAGAERTGDPARAQPAPAPARWVLGITGSLWLPRLYKLLDLTCLCNPPLPLHVPMLLRQQQVRAAVCFLPSFALLACGSRGEDSGFRPRPGPAAPEVPSCQAAFSSPPRAGVPEPAYRVCVRTRTSSELKILRHAWNS